MNKRQIRREANYRAGLILESVLNDWDPDELVARHGQDIVDAVSEEIWHIARTLRERGGDGAIVTDAQRKAPTARSGPARRQATGNHRQ